MTFDVGNIVEITGPGQEPGWIGLRARVIQRSGSENTRIELTDGRRPDGYSAPFYWTTDYLRLVASREETATMPTTEAPASSTTVGGFAVGDRVRTTRWFAGVDTDSTGTVTRIDRVEPSMGVKFDHLSAGGYYGNGEFLVPETYLFSCFEIVERAPAQTYTQKTGDIEVGDQVTLKSTDDFPDNSAIPSSLFCVVLTVIDKRGRVIDVERPNGRRSNGWSVDRFERVRVPVVAEPTPEPTPERVKTGPIEVGDTVIAKPSEVFSDNAPMIQHQPDMAGRLVVTRLYENARMNMVDLRGADGMEHVGWIVDRFQHAPAEPAPVELVEDAPTPEPTTVPADSLADWERELLGQPTPPKVGERELLGQPTPPKVGDRVRILGATHAESLIGSEGVIREISDPPYVFTSYDGTRVDHPWRVDLDVGGDFWASSVELVEDAPTRTPQVGDRVRLLAHIGGDAEVGDLGTITDDNSRRVDSFYVKFDGRRWGARGDGVHAVYASQFELVEAEPTPEPEPEPTPEPRPLQVGDKVTLKADQDRSLPGSLRTYLDDWNTLIPAVFTISSIDPERATDHGGMVDFEELDTHGGYYLDRFELAPAPSVRGYRVGDRVRTVREFDGADRGNLGTVSRLGADCDWSGRETEVMAVQFDDRDLGGRYGYGEYIVVSPADFRHFEKVEAAPTPEPTTVPADSLADWEHGGMVDFETGEIEYATPPPPEPEVAPTSYSIGDQVIVLASAAEDDSAETGDCGRAYRGETFPLRAEVTHRVVSRPGYYGLMSSTGRSQTVHVTHLRPAVTPAEATPPPPAPGPSAAHLRDIEIIGAYMAEQAKQGEADGGWCSAYDRLVEGLNHVLTVPIQGRHPLPEPDPQPPIFEFQVTRTYTVRARRTDDNRDIEPAEDYIQQSIRDANRLLTHASEIQLDSDWADVETTNVDTQVVHGSVKPID